MTSLSGKVTTGLGKGAYFIPFYKEKIKEVANIEPFQGTLNLTVDSQKRATFLQSLKNKKTIQEFKKGEKTFGAIDIFPVKIQKEKNSQESTSAAIIIPKKTTHKEDTIEIIAEENLREKLALNDGDEVYVTI